MILSSNPKDIKFMEDVVSDLIKENRDLINLLGLGKGIIDIKDPGPIIISKFEGKKIPTFFTLINHDLRKIPSNSFIRLQFKTDASNDYFDREIDQGAIKSNPPILTSKHIFNGLITVKAQHKPNAVIGNKEIIEINLLRPFNNPLTERVEVEYDEAIIKKINPPGPVPPPKGKSYSLPKHNLIKRENWALFNWDGSNIAEVTPSSNGNSDEITNAFEVNINEDPDVLRHFLRTKELTEERADIIRKRYHTAIFLYTLVVYNHFLKLGKKDIVPEVMKSVSKIILNLLFSEKLIKELEL
jgi:hypothetical protein